VDARRQWFSDVEKQPEAGREPGPDHRQEYSVIAEKNWIRRFRYAAIAGTVIVENPHTGEILALANPADI